MCRRLPRTGPFTIISTPSLGLCLSYLWLCLMGICWPSVSWTGTDSPGMIWLARQKLMWRTDSTANTELLVVSLKLFLSMSPVEPFSSVHRIVSVCRYGPNRWRDVESPLEILYNWVNREGVQEPQWAEDGREASIGADAYHLDTFGKSSAWLCCWICTNCMFL